MPAQFHSRAPEFVHTYYKLTGSNKLEPKDPKVRITAKVMFSVRLRPAAPAFRAVSFYVRVGIKK